MNLKIARSNIRQILLLLFCFISLSAQTQLSLEIDKLIISSIKRPNNDYIDHYDGPSLKFYCLVINESDKSVPIHPSHLNIFFSYYFDSHYYEKKEVSLNFPDTEPIVLASRDTISFSFQDHILLGLGLLNTKEDFSLELIKILPTIDVRIDSCNKKSIHSRKPKEVIIK